MYLMYQYYYFFVAIMGRNIRGYIFNKRGRKEGIANRANRAQMFNFKKVSR